jgi:hypothetical protein
VVGCIESERTCHWPVCCNHHHRLRWHPPQLETPPEIPDDLPLLSIVTATAAPSFEPGMAWPVQVHRAGVLLRDDVDPYTFLAPDAPTKAQLQEKEVRVAHVCVCVCVPACACVRVGCVRCAVIALVAQCWGRALHTLMSISRRGADA